MATLAELRSQYEDFLQIERFGLVERIVTSIDDFVHRSRSKEKQASKTGSVGWGCPRVKISMGELRSYSPNLTNRLIHDPLRHIRALEAACHAVASDERPGYDKEDVKMKIALDGPVKAAPHSPRGLTSSCLRQLVCVEGVATKVSVIKPKVVKSVHYCPHTAQHESREYVDATDPQLGLPAVDASGRELPDRIINITTSVYPTKDKQGNSLVTEFGLSIYKDHQTVTLQEMPEKAPMGQLPRSIELVLEHDLVDRIKPGDRVQVVGVYRALATSSTGQSSTSGLFKTVVLVNNAMILGRDVSHLTFSPQDIRTIRELAKRPNVLSLLGKSLSPSIYGHEEIKQALALQLLSGCEKNLENGTHLRGDINILLVGDPSTAKSQLLRSAMTVAPLAVSTTGKGSSGVGLTAAVTSDPETRERRLEAGAMVLADRGLVCVDEFDKMSENDRVAIHEAMEQQTVTIAKAGIHASLNARCSVLAAANPVYGQYDRTRRIQENIGLPDSLLSRFDLLFVVLDQLDPDSDRSIAGHVIKGHRYKGATMIDDDLSDDEDAAKTESVWQRHSNQEQDILQHNFLRKFLHFCKTRIKPVLTEGARDMIAHRYAEMRSRQDERTLPITARSLETVIRLASAHAKVRLSNVVEADPDCKIAMDLLSFALYHENMKSKDQQQQKQEEQEEVNEQVSKRQRRSDSSPTSNLQEVKQQIWNDLRRMGTDANLSELCKGVQDRSLVSKAANELADEGRIMMDEDGSIFVV